jgi:hypothetical protein
MAISFEWPPGRLALGALARARLGCHRVLAAFTRTLETKRLQATKVTNHAHEPRRAARTMQVSPWSNQLARGPRRRSTDPHATHTASTGTQGKYQDAALVPDDPLSPVEVKVRRGAGGGWAAPPNGRLFASSLQACNH